MEIAINSEAQKIDLKKRENRLKKEGMSLKDVYKYCKIIHILTLSIVSHGIRASRLTYTKHY